MWKEQFEVIIYVDGAIWINGRKALPCGNAFWGSKFMKCFMGCHILGGGTN